MANTILNFPGIPGTLTGLTVRLRNADSLAILATLTPTFPVDVWTATASGAIAGRIVFEFLVGGTVTDVQVRTIADDVGPYTVLTGLEVASTIENLDLSKLDNIPDDLEACLTQIKDKTDQIGNVTFIHHSNVPDSSGNIEIKQGDRKEITWTSDTEDKYPDLTGKVIRFGLKNGDNQLVELASDVNPTQVLILQPTGFQSVKLILFPSDTIAIPRSASKYDVQAEYAVDDVKTMFTGSAAIVEDYSGTP